MKLKPIKWQFSLRVMIALTVLLACALAPLASRIRRAGREQAIAEHYGAAAFYDFQYDEEEDEYLSNAVPPGPWILRRIFGDTLFASVHKLEITGQHDLVHVDRLQQLSNLKTLSIYNCRQLQNLNGLANSKLRFLHLDRCPQLKNIDALHGSTSLKSISIWRCGSLRNLDGIGTANLTRFNLRGCPLVTDIDALKGQTNLRFCHLNDCPGLKHVNGLTNRTLTSFSITDCDQLLTPRGLKNLGRARHVDLIRCDVRSLEDVWKFFDVRTMRLFRCPNLANVTAVDQAIRMETLEISECPSLTNLNGLQNSDADAVYIFHCDTLSNIKALDAVANLKYVRIEDCPQLDPAAITAIHRKADRRLKATTK